MNGFQHGFKAGAKVHNHAESFARELGENMESGGVQSAFLNSYKDFVFQKDFQVQGIDEPSIPGKVDRLRDHSQWTCANQKKLLDCKAYRLYSPFTLPAPLDKVYAELVLQQKRQKFRTCSGGQKHAWHCERDQDCGVMSGGRQVKCTEHDVVPGTVQVLFGKCSELSLDWESIGAMAY